MSISTSLKEGIILHSLEDTENVAKKLASELGSTSTIALTGDLGAGKTTFVQFLAKSLGITDNVTSPTFNIFNLYKGESTLAHIDAYRLKSADDMDGLMLEDIINAPYCIIVEWANLVEEWFPKDTLHLHLSVNESGERIIQLLKR